MSTLDHTLKPEATAVRRLEVITGTGRRRQFSEDFKASIVEETLVPGAVISEVARRNGLSPQQVFTWRRQARRPAASTDGGTPHFVPAVVETGLPERAARGPRRKRTGQMDRASGSIEVEIEGVTVRIGRGAQVKTVAAVLRALKAGA
ncbi:MAG: transposase [Bradyrhizobium sp.]